MIVGSSSARTVAMAATLFKPSRPSLVNPQEVT
jgi:hypothetical protein